MGRYGPFVQIGTREDEEKPTFASLRPGQKMDRISLEEALELFKLPRELGQTDDGLPVSANIGRYGPYVRYGNKYVNLREDDPHTIELPRALELSPTRRRQPRLKSRGGDRDTQGRTAPSDRRQEERQRTQGPPPEDLTLTMQRTHRRSATAPRPRQETNRRCTADQVVREGRLTHRIFESCARRLPWPSWQQR